MDNQFQQKIKIVLTVFADGKPRDVQDESVFDMNTITWLFENGYINGIDTSDKDGDNYLDLIITEKGLEFVKQIQKELVTSNSRQSIYENKHPMASKVVVGVTITLIGTAIIAFFTWLFTK